MSTIKAHILAAAARLPEGGLLSPGEFTHLGGRSAVARAFAALVREEKLSRICRGVYTPILEGSFGKHCAPVEKILKALSVRTMETFTITGGFAANVLGFSTQVPVRYVFLTSGRSRIIKKGSCLIELRHAPSWLLLLPGKTGGDLIRALYWMGESWAKKICSQICHKIVPPEEWEFIKNISSKLPN